MKILVGLGNPGQKYEGHRHNIGFMALDAIASRYGGGQWRKRFQGEVAEIDIGRTRYLLLKPMTYMNESGRAVGEAMRFYKVSPADVIVFHDELDLQPGKLKVKFGGGHAGHNGLKSISSHIGNEYQRVRLGIGHPGHRDAVSGYVLHDFARADKDWLEPLLDSIAQAAPHLVSGQDAKFMNDVARATRPDTQRANGQQTAPSKAADTVAPAAKPSAPKPEAVAAKAEPVKQEQREPAMAEAASETVRPSAASAPKREETSLGAKLKAWFSRG
ncbi:MAG: aminoacyl-tRNA hydrolase [Rhodomicrobiaceae bacterium]